MENLKSVINILKNIENNSSTKKKLEILNENKDNTLLKDIIDYTYNKVKRVYNIKPKSIRNNLSINCDFNEDNLKGDNYVDLIFNVLDNLDNRKYTGNNAIAICNELVSKLDEETVDLFYKILDRDLKIGVNGKTLNKVWKDIIPLPKYCRCDTFNKKAVSKFEFPAFIQLKCDGTYREVHIHNSEVQIRTRSGEPYSNPVIEDQMKDLPEGYYMGEFTIGEADQQFNRFEANGNINSDNPNYNNIHFTMWDYVTEKEYNGEMNKPYHLRFNALEGILGIAKRLPHRGKNLHTVISKEVNDMQEALKFVSGWMSFGLEGGVLKSKNAKFKNGTSKEQLKIKLSIDLEMRCKGFLLGTEGTRFEGKNKVILFENDEGTIKGQCSGMTDAMVDEVTKNPNKYIGKVLTIQFNDLSKADGNEYYALSHPRFKEWRDDKDETDTLEKAFKMKEMATTLKD